MQYGALKLRPASCHVKLIYLCGQSCNWRQATGNRQQAQQLWRRMQQKGRLWFWPLHRLQRACYLLSLRFDLLPLLLCIINSLSMKTNLQPGRLSPSPSLSWRIGISRQFVWQRFTSALGHCLFNSIAFAISASAST